MPPGAPHAGARPADKTELVEVTEGAGRQVAPELSAVLAGLDRFERHLRLQADAAVDRRIHEHLVDPGRGQRRDGLHGCATLGPDVLELARELAARVGDVPRLL